MNLFLLAPTALALGTVHVPGDADTLSEALRLVDEGGTILVGEDNTTAGDTCAVVRKDVTIQGEGDHPAIGGIWPQDIQLTLDNLTLAGQCYGSTSAGDLSSYLTAHMIVYGGSVVGTDLVLKGQDGAGILVSDSTVELSGLSASGMMNGPVFFAEVYQALTSLTVRQAELNDNQYAVILARRYASDDPALQLRFYDSHFIGNHDDNAPVLYAENVDASFEGCTFVGVGMDGGGLSVPAWGLIHVGNSLLNIANSSFSGILGTYGGAIHVAGLPDDGEDTVNISDVTVSQVGAEIGSGYGGFLYAENASVTLTRVFADQVFATGGALVKAYGGSSLFLKDSAVTNYEVESSGAVYVHTVTDAQILRTRFCAGSTQYDQAATGIEAYDVGMLTLQNSFAHAMNSPNGYFLHALEGGLQLHNNTFAGNMLRSLIAFEADTLSLQNNIFAHSPGATGVDVWYTPETWSVGYNLWYSVARVSQGFDEIFDPTTDRTDEPGFVPDWTETDCASYPLLHEGSPAIDAGNPDPVWNDADGSRNDIGAFGGPGGTWTFADDTDDSADPSSDGPRLVQLVGGNAGCAHAPAPLVAWPALLLAAFVRRRVSR